ncbi:nickel and/or cobalt ABC transporter, permease subunit MN [Candidatus Desulfosporosinus infrequens]|uniref:Nickel and/or cobalt ABC transporter, permease subunit MN n=1 Tax=Candidatus Desulfosporosinus infrequens TaxID=2043169 RepID=A0A2U3LPD4_9FIRM|nr:nickel and/or cobalt ABC transporter, permease subunit MN [Candidatus Desulfosporosinus infrequens]
MHIPDGYLSPQTDAVLGFVSAITAAVAASKTASTVRAKYIPMLSVGAAFSFTLMMFNVPIPDGTTAHAVGGSLLAVILGPWAAMISVSIALIIQALFFGDGGILALGANIFNMAVVLPFVSYAIFQLIAGKSETLSKRRMIGAGIAGYIGLNMAALCAGIEFGLQPLLFHAANGTPLYSPYGLGVAVPAMLFAHLTIAGPVEGVVTGLVIAYLQRTNPVLLQMRTDSGKSTSHIPYGRYIAGLIVVALLTPLGLMASGTAWGEWGGKALQAQLGFVPSGLEKLGDFWNHVLFKGYGITGFDQTFWQQALGYIISAFFALLVIGSIGLFIQRMVRKSEGHI